jgi:Abnormal spindle-like microcephaly-assoc'd, ASPM-SPD-2-Hydin
LSFSTPLGTSSASQTITVTNTGGAALGISGIAANQPFAIMTSTCTGSLAGGASCSVNISFTPQTSGSVTGAFTITDNASGSPQSVALTGTTPAAVSLSPSSLTFSGQAIGTTSAAQTVTLSNTGGASLSISSIATSLPFAQTNNCPASLAGGTSCTISVTFTPQSSGSASGAVSITDNAGGSPQSVTLAGTTPAVASLSPSSLTFPATLIGSTATQTVTLTNTGGASMNITGLSYPNPFSVPSQNCLGTLAGGASCQITVAFKPTASGPVSGVLQIADTASGSPQSVTLNGTGIAPAAVSISTSSLSFGSQLVATTSAAQTVTLTNTGGASLSISSISTSQPFGQTNNCPASLVGGASCTINVTFTPQASGAVNGVLTITDSAAGSPQSVNLAGTGAVAAPTLSPASLSFGNQMVGTSSGNQTVKLTANSPGPLAISSISVSVGFTETSNCPASLNPGASCNISIAFQPSTAGAITGTLTIVDNGLGSPHTLSLSGTGLDFSVSAAPSSVTINSGAHPNYTVTVSGLGGSFNHNVSLSCSGLPAQSSCSFSPSGLTPGSGSVSSVLTIKTAHANGTSGTQPGTYTITITGNSNPLVHSTTVTLVVN